MRLQSLFINCETKWINEMIEPQIKEMIKKKIIIRNIKERTEVDEFVYVKKNCLLLNKSPQIHLLLNI